MSVCRTHNKFPNAIKPPPTIFEYDQKNKLMVSSTEVLDISPSQIPNISPSIISQMTKKQLYSLSQEHIESLTRQQIASFTPSRLKYVYTAITNICPCCNKPRDVVDNNRYNKPEYGDGEYCKYCNVKSIYNPNDHFHCCEL